MSEEILTLQEVANYLKVAEKTVYRMVKSRQLPAFKVRNQWRFKKDAIDKWIEFNNISVTNSANDRVEIPIIGRVSAGSPIFAEEYMEGTLTVDKSMVRQTDGVFALRIKGNSMVDAGIKDGDFVIIQQQPQVNQGEIAVVLIDNEATVKRVYREKDIIRLQPENESMPPIIVDPKEKEVSIIGKVKGVIRKM
jgi:repressor LexA